MRISWPVSERLPLTYPSKQNTAEIKTGIPPMSLLCSGTFLVMCVFHAGCPFGGAGGPLLRRELVAVVLQPGVADPAGPVYGLRAHANGGLPPGHQTTAGQRI